MDAELHDLRILHLALGVEESLETLQGGLASHLKDSFAQQAAESVMEDGPAHKELEAAYNRLNESLASRSKEFTESEILESLLEGERQAKAFYSEWGPLLKDARLQDLFLRMSEEEAAHAEIIGRQIAFIAEAKK